MGINNSDNTPELSSVIERKNETAYIITDLITEFDETVEESCRYCLGIVIGTAWE
jgi:hypothetical protein